jgi:hypothetical protein
MWINITAYPHVYNIKILNQIAYVYNEFKNIKLYEFRFTTIFNSSTAILLQIESYKYIAICNSIYEFNTDGKIIQYDNINNVATDEYNNNYIIDHMIKINIYNVINIYEYYYEIYQLLYMSCNLLCCCIRIRRFNKSPLINYIDINNIKCFYIGSKCSNFNFSINPFVNYYTLSKQHKLYVTRLHSHTKEFLSCDEYCEIMDNIAHKFHISKINGACIPN